MGLNVSVYKFPLGDATNGGISSGVKSLTLINVEGPSEPNAEAPAAMLVMGNMTGTLKIVPAKNVGGLWLVKKSQSEVGPMMGGNLAYTSDSRFFTAAETLLGHRFYGGIPIHDRFESQELNDMMSR